MKRVTRWSPDTCGCILEYAWDDLGTYTINRVIKRCAAHTSGKDEDLLNVLLEENRRKNTAIDLVGVQDISWSFDTDRNLILKMPSESERSKAQQKCKKVKKVKVE